MPNTKTEKMNSHQKRKTKRSNLKAERKANKLIEAENGRKGIVATASTPDHLKTAGYTSPQTLSANPHPQTTTANEKDRFKENPTMDELFSYMKEQHLKH